MNYQHFTYNLIRTETPNIQKTPITSQSYINNIEPQLDSSSCCCCCCCCTSSLCCQCLCHLGLCCQGNCQITPTTMPTVDICEHTVDEGNLPKTTRHIRRDKSSIQIKPSSIEANSRLNVKLKGSQSYNNIFNNNNLSSLNRDTYTIYNRNDQSSPSIENENVVRKEEMNERTINVGGGRKSKSFVNIMNTGNSTNEDNSKIKIEDGNNNNKHKEGKKKYQNINQNTNNKIKYDLENFNQELLALKRKLANGKKSIPKYPVSIDKVTTTNSNNSSPNHIQIETPSSNYNNLNMYYPKDNTRNNNNHHPKNKVINNTFRGNTNLSKKEQIPNGHCVIPINKPKAKYPNNKKQHFSFTIFGEPLLDNNQLIINEKDGIIDNLTQKINSLTLQLNNLNKQYQDKINALQKELHNKNKQLDKQENDIKYLKQQIQAQQYKKPKRNGNEYSFQKPHSLFIKASYDIPQGKRIVTTTTTVENTKTKKMKMSSSASASRLLNKLQLNTDLTLSSSSYKYHKQYPISNQLLFKNHSPSQSIICFDYVTKIFHFFNYADFNNFDINSYTSEGALFFTYNSILYMIIGSNFDMLYSYTFKNNSINKLCQLNNNHHYGAFAMLNKEELICVGGSHNKKVEVYSIHKNEWKEIPELNIERSEFAICVINERYIYALFGYNAVTKEYLNTIEYFDYGKRMDGIKWKYLKYENEEMISMYIKGHIAGEIGGKIIIMGGVNGNDNAPEENFIVVGIGNGDDNDEKKYQLLKVEKVERKVKDIYKNSAYMFGTSFSEICDENGREFLLAFDDDNHVHSIQKGNLGHDVFYSEQ